MGRRKNESVLDMLFEIAAMLPWWVGVGLAVVAYFGFHIVAVSPLPAPKPDQMGTIVGQATWKAVASALQYVLPLVLLAGAAASALSRHRRKALVAEVADGEDASVLGGMTWQEFEVLVSEAFKLQGYAVTETGGGGADGGIDLVLRKGNEKFLVQCKQWRAMRVGVSTVRELYGVMAAEKAAGGFVVSSGTYTADAIEFARGRNVELVDGRKLFAMFDNVRASGERAARRDQAAVGQVEESAAPGVAVTPNCPRCGKSMVKRMARKGASAGKPFWGCVGFPDCQGTRPSL